MSKIGYHPTDKARANMSRAQMGRTHSEETKNKIRLSKLGKHRSDATKAKLSIITKTQWQNPEFKAKMSKNRKGMILTEETKLKMSLAHKGKVFTAEHKSHMGKSRIGKPLTETTKARISQATIGRRITDEHRIKLIQTNTGSTRTEETKAKMRQSWEVRRLKPEYWDKVSRLGKVRWRNPEYKDRCVKAMRLGRYTHPNRPEKAVLDLLDQMYPEEWVFTGDGSFVIGGKNPDFVNADGQKKFIELFGNYWHRGENPQDRINLFARYGFSTLVIWEKELNELDSLRTKLKLFCGNAQSMRTSLRRPNEEQE